MPDDLYLSGYFPSGYLGDYWPFADGDTSVLFEQAVAAASQSVVAIFLPVSSEAAAADDLADALVIPPLYPGVREMCDAGDETGAEVVRRATPVVSDSWNDPVVLEALWSRRKKVSVQLKVAAVTSAPMPLGVSLSREKIVLETLPLSLARSPIILSREPLELVPSPVGLERAPLQILEAPTTLLRPEALRVQPPVTLARIPVTVAAPIELVALS